MSNGLRMTAERAAEISAKNRAAYQRGGVKDVFGTLTERPTYQAPIVAADKRLLAVYELPYPPTLNTYWRHITATKTLLSAGGRAYRRKVIEIAGALVASRERLRVLVELNPPDKRKRDLDNCVKAIFDSLQHAHVFHDDEQIDEFTVKRGPIVPGGRCTVTLWTEAPMK